MQTLKSVEGSPCNFEPGSVRNRGLRRKLLGDEILSGAAALQGERDEDSEQLEDGKRATKAR